MPKISQAEKQQQKPVPARMVSAITLAAGGALLCALYYAGMALEGGGAAASGRLLLRYILPAAALLFIGAAFYLRRMLDGLEAMRHALSEREADARFLSLHDPLSQLPNRRLFMQSLRERLRGEADGSSAPALCVARIEIDRFRDIVEALGDGAGDAILMQLGPRLQPRLEPDDLLAHFGGDLFAVARHFDAGDTAGALTIAILSAFDQPFDVSGHQIAITVSVGVAVAGPGDTDPDRILREADIDLRRNRQSRLRQAFARGTSGERRLAERRVRGAA